MKTMTLTNGHATTTVLILEERAKAIKVRGNASEAWFPRKAIDANGNVADWFSIDMAHAFLWECPFDLEKMHPEARASFISA
jgi:hypothetical protein